MWKELNDWKSSRYSLSECKKSETERKWVNVNKKQNKINEIEVVKQEIWTQKRLRGVDGSLKAGSAKVEPGYVSSDPVLGEAWGRIPITSIFMWSDSKVELVRARLMAEVTDRREPQYRIR